LEVCLEVVGKRYGKTNGKATAIPFGCTALAKRNHAFNTRRPDEKTGCYPAKRNLLRGVFNFFKVRLEVEVVEIESLSFHNSAELKRVLHTSHFFVTHFFRNRFTPQKYSIIQTGGR
jgi:hypothetical protein